MESPKTPIVLDADILNAGYVTNELLPCPFCGNENILTSGFRNESTGIYVYKAYCSDIFKCGGDIVASERGEDGAQKARSMVVTKWNRRA